MDKFAYKIENADIWAAARRAGIYYGSDLDAKDGFIHLSTKAQLAATLSLHFKGKRNLIVAKINLQDYEHRLKWETSRNGELFPHIYSAIDTKTIEKEFGLETDHDGNFILPQDL